MSKHQVQRCGGIEGIRAPNAGIEGWGLQDAGIAAFEMRMRGSGAPNVRGSAPEPRALRPGGPRPMNHGVVLSRLFQMMPKQAFGVTRRVHQVCFDS